MKNTHLYIKPWYTLKKKRELDVVVDDIREHKDEAPNNQNGNDEPPMCRDNGKKDLVELAVIVVGYIGIAVAIIFVLTH